MLPHLLVEASRRKGRRQSEHVVGDDVDVVGEPVFEVLLEVHGAGLQAGGFSVGADVPGEGLFHYAEDVTRLKISTRVGGT